MNNQYTKGTPLTVIWYLKRPDGTAYSLEGFQYVLKGKNSRGSITIPTSVVNYEQGYISFVLTSGMQTSTGYYSFSLDLCWDGRAKDTINATNVIEIVRADVGCSTCQDAHVEDESVCRIFSVGQFNLFDPSAPIPGTDGFWYFDGKRLKDSQGNDIPINYTLHIYTEGENAGRIVINEGRENEQVIDNLKLALSKAETAEAEREDNETTRQSQETTRQRQEAERQSTFESNEQTRQGEFDAAQQNRSTAFSISQGLMQATFSGNEQNRQETFEENEEARQEQAEADHEQFLVDHLKNISSVDVKYNSSSSAVTPPATGWSSEIPAVESGRFLWTRTTTRYNGYPTVPDSISYSVGLLTLVDSSVTIGKLAEDAKRMIETHPVSQTIIANIEPNILHVWTGAMDTLRITSLATPEHDDIANEYMFQFTTSADWEQEESPFANIDGIVWNDEPVCKAECLYEVSILNGVGIIMAIEIENE